MPYQCRLVENPELNEHGNVDITKLQIGDMWYLDCDEAELKERNLTAQYWQENHPNRKPLVVKLPNNTIFVVDSQGWGPEKGHYDCWRVTGSPPNITVEPSINFVGRYHGFLKNGVISDPM